MLCGFTPYTDHGNEVNEMQICRNITSPDISFDFPPWLQPATRDLVLRLVSPNCNPNRNRNRNRNPNRNPNPNSNPYPKPNPNQLTRDPVERLGCGGGGVRDVLAAELLQEIRARVRVRVRVRVVRVRVRVRVVRVRVRVRVS